jgi:murein DD-endopeptidase MepM/ murein hydrolase activator NlpD
MLPRRYSVVIADPSSGVERRLQLPVRPVVAVVGAVVTLPILIGLGAAWKAKADVATLFSEYHALQLENANYRQATEALSGQIDSLQRAVTDLGARAALDPALAATMEKLPALVKARAMGGNTGTPPPAQQRSYAQTLTALANPEDTFGLLRTVLEGLDSSLSLVRRTVEKRNALAAATPAIWPAHGWLTSRMGNRVDPMTGGNDFHAGLDIAGDRGQPVFATAAGTVVTAEYHGNYGNIVTIDHGYGLETRYGHLQSFEVKKGAKVQRGDIIGRVGATGRATGTHLHYEVLANGTLLNPLRLLTTQKARDQ